MPDAEKVVVAALSGLVDPAVRLVTVTPSDLEGQVPLVQVERVSGATERFRDLPLLYVSAFAATREAASDLARAVDDAVLHKLPGLTAVGGRVQNVEGQTGFRWIPYDNPDVWRYQAIYSLTIMPVG